MKKLLLTCSVSALLVGACGGAAAAQDASPPWLHATTVLTKTVATNEAIAIVTNVAIVQPVVTVADDAAEASATGNQTNSNNKDCGNCAEKADALYYSQDDNTGLTSVNQAGGNDNNQGTLVSAAVDSYRGTTPTTPTGTPTTPTGTPTAGQGFAHAQAEAQQTNSGNDVEAVDLTFRNALVDHSINRNTGLAYFNQSTGNNNNQLNELSLAFSERPSGTALAEADLGQFNTGNRVGEGSAVSTENDPNDTTGIHKSATVTASLNNNIGVFGVNQSVGNNGNQANIVSIAAVGSSLPGF
jgi:hypothetical protein